MLRLVWAEMVYRLDVCRDTKDEHIEHIWGMQSKLGEFLFLSVCSTVPSFPSFKSTIFFVICQGIMNIPVENVSKRKLMLECAAAHSKADVALTYKKKRSLRSHLRKLRSWVISRYHCWALTCKILFCFIYRSTCTY
jgi:hypothetical protein